MAPRRRIHSSSTARKTYREDLAKELKEIDEQEIWRAGQHSCLFLLGWLLNGFRFAGKTVRSLRPDYKQ